MKKILFTSLLLSLFSVGIHSAFAASYSITSSAGAGGSISPSGTNNFTAGQPEIAPSGYHAGQDYIAPYRLWWWIAINPWESSSDSITRSALYDTTYFNPNLYDSGYAPPTQIPIDQPVDYSQRLVVNIGFSYRSNLPYQGAYHNWDTQTFTPTYTDDPGQPYIAPYYADPGQAYIAPSGYHAEQAYIAPANQTYTITPNTGYSISSVTVDGGGQGAIGSYTFSNIQTNHTISATFCVTYSGSSCSATSSANACGGTNTTYGTYDCAGSCSASTPGVPANPAGYNTACTGPTSAPNACGQTNPGGAGTIQCNGSCSGTTGITPANSSCPVPSIVIFSASPLVVGLNGASTLSWSVTNATSCWASGGWSGWVSSISGNSSQTINSSPKIFSLECWNVVGVSSGIRSVTITIPSPTVDLKIEDPISGLDSDGPITSGITTGDTLNISWTSTNATSCTAGGPGFGGSGNPRLANDRISLPAKTGGYTLYCDGPGGTSPTDTVQITLACPLSWGAWSQCNKSCGGGVQSRSGISLTCEAIVGSQSCNTTACGGFNWTEVAP